MQKTDALAYIAGADSKESSEASAPTNLHVISGEVVEDSEDGKVLVNFDGLVFSEENNQYVEIDALGGLKEGDTATVVLSGENGKAMVPLAIGGVGTIDRIVADVVEANLLIANKAEIQDLNAATARIGGLEADHVSVSDLNATNASVTELTAENATITGRLSAAELAVQEISSDYLKTADLEAEKARVGSLLADKADIKDLSAATARIGDIEADYLKTADMTAETARVNNLLADKASVSDLSAATARVGALEASTADIDTIRANSAKVKNLTAAELEADHAAINSLDATYAKIDMANVNNAWITNGTIKDAAISDGMINSVSANKLTAGTIDASVVNVSNINADNITVGTINGQRIGQGSLSLDKLSEDVYTEAEVDAKLSNMQKEIDGAIETWTGTAVPTLNNSPAKDWKDSATRDTHVGDVYFVVNSSSQQNGYNYRFTKNGNTYEWQLIKDNDVTQALKRLTDAEGSITKFDEEISTIKTDTGTLKTKTTQLETSLGDKVDSTTFNSLSDTVDGHTQSITQLTTAVSSKADGSTVTSLTNRVNKTETDISGINTKIGSLETTVKTKADNTTVTTISNKVNNISDTVDGHTQSITNVTTTVNGIRKDVDESIVKTTQLWIATDSAVKPKAPVGHNDSGLTDQNGKYIVDSSGNNILGTSVSWSENVPAWNSANPYYYYCFEYEHVDGSYTYSTVVYDQPTTSVRTEYAEFKQTVNEFESTIGKSVSDLDGRVSTAETSIQQNSDEILLRATKTEAYQNAQPNLAPLLSVDFSSVYNASSYPSGYWRTNPATMNFTQLEDGWAHFEMDNSSGTATSNKYLRPARVPYIEPGKPYTILVEIRNNNPTGTGTHDLYLQQIADNQFWGNTSGEVIDDTYKTTSTSVNLLTCGDTYSAYSYRLADTEHLTDDKGWVFTYNFSTAAGAANSFDVRMSIYAGIYSGPYKPYAGSKLYASQAELKVANDSISSKVSTTDYTGAKVASLINQSAESVKIQAKHVEIDGTAVFNAAKSQMDAAYDAKGAASAVQTNLDNLEIGGRNLLRWTADATGHIDPGHNAHTAENHGWDVNSGGNGVGSIVEIDDSPVPELTHAFRISNNSSGNRDWQQRVEDFAMQGRDGSWVFSAYARAIGASATYLVRVWSASQNFGKQGSIGTAWTRLEIPVKLTGTVGNASATDSPNMLFGLTGSGSIEYIAPKLERGTKATDWTPAPEDVDASVNSAVNAAGGFDILWNRAEFATDTNAGGECYLCAYDPTTATRTDANGWAMWNGTKRTITKGMFNPNAVLPYNIPIYIVCRLSSATATTGTNYMVWYDGSWKSGPMSPSASTVAAWTWAEATDMVLGKFVEPGSEVAFTECETYRQPLKWGAITTDTVTARSANAAAAAAQTTANTANTTANTANSKLVAFRGVCSTAAGTAAKVVACAGFALTQGYSITVYNTTAQTVAGAITLNVNSLGAKNVWVAGAVTSDTNRLLWAAGSTVTFVYDGTQFRVADNPPSLYGTTCTIAEGTAAKTTTANECVIFKGASITVPMSNSNTAASPTLNVTSLGASAIYYGSGTTGPTKANGFAWPATAAVIFTFDGKFWRCGNQTFIDGGNILTGTIAADRIKANVISAVNNGTGTINADKINASALSIGYSQLTGTPTIPSKTSQLSNDSGFATSSELNSARTWYANCSSAGGDPKVATISPTTSSFTLTTGVVVYVKFTTTNSLAVASLTLNVNGTGAKPIKRYGTTNMAEVGNITGGMVCQFVYDGINWLWVGHVDTNSTYNLGANQHSSAIKAKSAITRYFLICGNADGYQHVAAGAAFDLSYPILYAHGGAIAANATATNTYETYPGAAFSTTGTIESGAANKMLWLRGEVSGNTFTIGDDPFLTTLTPTSEDGLAYVPLGIMTSATAGYFQTSKELYAYKAGAFGPVSVREAGSVSEALGELVEDVGDLSDQFSDSFAKANADIEKISQDLISVRQEIEAEVDRRSKWLNFDSVNGLQIGAEGSEFRTVTDEISMAFMQGGTVLAKASGVDGFDIPVARINEMHIGNWMFVPRQNGNLALKWIG